MQASDLLVRCLEREGIEYIFGVPGEENADFVMSLERSETIRFVLTRHEQGAAFMAEAYGRLTGNPAVCLGTLGPGATNLITGVADCNMDRAPMLVLTGQGSTARLHKESHQIMDVVAMFEPVTKWATTIVNADTIPEIVRKAVRVARTEKPGAVLIELPEDVAKLESDAVPLEPRRFRRSVPDDVVVDSAFEMLSQARQPRDSGRQRVYSQAGQRTIAASCASGPESGCSVHSWQKVAWNMDAEYYLYTIGLGSKDLPTLVVDEADLVITLGFDMVEYHPRLWNPNGEKRIIHADFLPAEIDSDYLPEIELIGDLAHTLGMLNERIENSQSLNFDLTRQRELRKRMGDEIAAHAADTTTGSIRPQKVLWDVPAKRSARMTFSCRMSVRTRCG